MTEPGPSNAAPGGAANGASGDAHCDCAHCTAHYGLIRSSCPQCAQCQEDHRRLSATGGYAEGGYSNAKGGAGGQGGKGGKFVQNQTFNQYPDQQTIEELRRLNDALNNENDELKKKDLDLRELQRKEKVRLEEREQRLFEQEKAQKDEQRKWEDSTKKFENALQETLKSEQQDLVKNQAWAAAQKAIADVLRASIDKLTASVFAAKAKNEELVADKMQLEEDAKQLKARLDQVGQLDPFMAEQQEDPWGKEIEHWENEFKIADKDVLDFDELVTQENNAKLARDEKGMKYTGDLEECKKSLFAARERKKICEGKVQELKGKRRPQLHSLNSDSSSRDSQSKTADIESTAPTEWSCDCGSLKLELVRGAVKCTRIRSSLTVFGKSGEPGEDET